MNARQATESDVPSILVLLLAFCQEYLKKTIEKSTAETGIRHVFAQPYLGRYYVCEFEGKVISYSFAFFEWSDWRAGNMFYIESAYTVPEHRAKGAFRLIFRAMHDDALLENSAIRVIASEGFPVESLGKLGLEESHYRVFEIKH